MQNSDFLEKLEHSENRPMKNLAQKPLRPAGDDYFGTQQFQNRYNINVNQ